MVNDTTLLLDLDEVSVARVEWLADGRGRVHLVTVDERRRACPGLRGMRHPCEGLGGDPATRSPSRRERIGVPLAQAPLVARKAGCPRRSFTEQIPQIPAGARLTGQLRDTAGRRIRDAGSTVIQAARDLHLS
ncbi:hypothetical protein AB0M58_36220 [Streptomyces bobili]|uniref:hypothetical protein n=1 Tax=Streptomyces bobili TaxID=67280 RepID=UPI00343A7E2F